MATVGHRLQTICHRWADLNSLQVRLTAGVVLASLVAIATLTGWLGWRTQAILLDSYFHQASLVVERFAEDVSHYATQMPIETALQMVIDHRTTGDLAIWVTTAEGDLLTQSETLSMGSWQMSGVADDLLQMAIAEGIAIQSVRAWVFVVCAEPLPLAGLPAGTLHLASDITAEYQGFQQLIRMLWLSGLAMVTLLAVACAVYIRRALRPLRQLNHAASQVTAETLGHHQFTLPTAATEVAELVRTYNLMLGRLAKAWAQQKRFINDVSHELRTPLTLVQGYLESTLRRGSSLTPPQRQGLEIAATETSRTIHLLTELLELARLDNHQLVLALEPTDLVAVVTAAIALVEADHPDAPSRIDLDIPALSPVVKVDRNKLVTVLVELLDNALRYADPQQPIRVVVLGQPDWGLVQVHDQGPGISAQVQAAIFDPFYRVDEDRSRRTGGTGLGLTLVRSLVDAMGGLVSLRSQPQQGCVFTIALPT
jgi:signal transduction histidine kinase